LIEGIKLEENKIIIGNWESKEEFIRDMKEKVIKVKCINRNSLLNRLLGKGLVFGTSAMLFVATMASVGVVAASGGMKEGLVISIKGSNPSLSPDWEKVAYSSSRDEKAELWVINIDGSNLRKLDEWTWYKVHHLIGWSPDSRKILYYQYSDLSHWIVNSDGTGKKQVTKDAWPAVIWSPSGSKIAYNKRGEGLYVTNSDGSDKRFITSGISLIWTPDGKKIIFTEETKPYNFDIWEIDLDSAVTKKLTNITPQPYGRIVISPDGSKIAYENHGIWIVNIAGSNLKQLTYSDKDVQPSWSPDSKRIAFISEEKGIREGLWIMNSDGSNQKKVVVGDCIALGWSRDGGKIAYAVAKSENELDIYAINIGKPSPIKPPTEKKPGIPGFDAIFAIAGLLAVAYLFRRSG
jgi:TolB protein